MFTLALCVGIAQFCACNTALQARSPDALALLRNLDARRPFTQHCAVTDALLADWIGARALRFDTSTRALVAHANPRGDGHVGRDGAGQGMKHAGQGVRRQERIS